ncbi:DJ-1 family glyoxalase III [Streptococcus himalayensis]|uniref:4-methyl-5(B-hydroxyethyl)-thiazole monophosphate biosynthesis protein n=1 Tax=Streptococcus himalayensis TaxID=1888195 RepID=A0A917EEF9_9STRE|nr:DJ-1 family glyoxalase III [Streptococcus himalayensis]GGE25374.1 4-methyl-5(B-hydroxyethyl)-thiazole monophosphate biosynthesis protein [Streptococcus himalayensis]
MAKVAVILANGFEEIEALTVVDVLRRGDITCDMLSVESEVTGSHGITVKGDRLWDGSLEGYDMVVLPGGMPGAANLRDDETLMAALQNMKEQEKWIAAICAAPIALERAGILEGKSFTCYDGVEKEIASGRYLKETVVVDGKLITSRGPSTALAFAYELLHQLGGDSDKLATAMLYKDVFGV